MVGRCRCSLSRQRVTIPDPWLTSATAVTWRFGWTISVPRRKGPTQSSSPDPVAKVSSAEPGWTGADLPRRQEEPTWNRLVELGLLGDLRARRPRGATRPCSRRPLPVPEIRLSLATEFR